MLDLIECDEPTPQQLQEYHKGKFRKHPPWKMWSFGEHKRTAKKVLDCSECYIPILPGDTYMEEVFVCKGKFLVKRRHHPQCPHDPWEDDEFGDNFDEADCSVYSGPPTLAFPAPLRRAA